jgi:hypothetical protein
MVRIFGNPFLFRWRTNFSFGVDNISFTFFYFLLNFHVWLSKISKQLFNLFFSLNFIIVFIIIFFIWNNLQNKRLFFNFILLHLFYLLNFIFIFFIVICLTYKTIFFVNFTLLWPFHISCSAFIFLINLKEIKTLINDLFIYFL